VRKWWQLLVVVALVLGLMGGTVAVSAQSGVGIMRDRMNFREYPSIGATKITTLEYGSQHEVLARTVSGL